jgi:hypothetical protein
MTTPPIVSPKGLRTNRETAPDFPKPDQATVDKIFNNYWTVQADAPWANSQLGMR